PSQPPDALLPVQWDGASPWCFRIEVERDDAAGEYVVNGFLVRDDSRKPLAEPLLLVPGLVFYRDHVARFDDGNMFHWVRMLRSAGELKIPQKQRNEFLAEIAQFPVLPSMNFPDELSMDQLTLEKPPELKIHPIPPARKIRVEGRVRCGLVRAARPRRFRRPFRGNAAIAESYRARRAQCAAWRWHVWIASGGVVEEVPDGSGPWEIQ